MSSERHQKYDQFLGKPENRFEISFSPSTNQEILDGCQSHLDSNPPSKTSAPYLLDFTIATENPIKSMQVDLFGIDMQSSEWYDIFLFINGKPARVMLQTNQGNSNAILCVIKDSDIPDFDDDRITNFIEWLAID